MDSDNVFGFGSPRPKTAVSEKLSRIKPQADPSKDVLSMAKVDKVADEAGFRSREPAHTNGTPASATPSARRKKEPGPFVAINTRAPTRVAEPFQRFCDEHRYSYWEGIEALMKKTGLI